MSDVRELLGRAAADVSADEAALDQIRERADRRVNRRRRSALAVGLAIACVGILAPLVALRIDRTQTNAASDAHALWPQSSIDRVRAAQAAADAGDSSFVWQADGQRVVERFLQESVGWDYVRLIPVENAERIAQDVGPIDDPSLLATAGPIGPVRVFAAACPPEPGQLCAAAYVTVERLVRDTATGVWVVIAFEETAVAYPEQLGSSGAA